MPYFHIHVYRVVGMKEYTLEASDEIEAKRKALEMAKAESSLTSPDCEWIAISWEFVGGDNKDSTSERES